MSIKVFLSKNDKGGTSEIINAIKRNEFVRNMFEPILIESKDHMLREKLIGIPAIKIKGEKPKYGTEAFNYVNWVIKKNRPTAGSDTGGSDFVQIGEDDSVTFDPSRIRDASDFVIPDAPIGKGNDLDTSIARLQADRDSFDAEFDAKARY